MVWSLLGDQVSVVLDVFDRIKMVCTLQNPPV